ncbi:MAG: hypothetical protein LBH18_00445 [Spirochaetaceae bacterium]|nr:hypothetical protein [Spirochaetaceae bacterium]
MSATTLPLAAHGWLALIASRPVDSFFLSVYSYLIDGSEGWSEVYGAAC